ncbi:MAG: hypothetical protein WC777_02585 [Candidatus Gracilibacteria bacterium]|jgi:hypothetical protein
MAMTAKLASTLTKDRLAPGALDDERDLSMHGLAYRDGFLLFDGQAYKPSVLDRGRGLDPSSGDIYLGDVQFETSVVNRFVGSWYDGMSQANIRVSEGRFMEIPTLFEIERLFVGDVGRFEVSRMYGDGVDMGDDIARRENGLFQRWHQEYLSAVDGSLMGKPVLEADFARRLSGGSRPLDLTKLYGERIHDQLRGLKRRDLKEKYPERY